jgi:hypothetical protein
MKPRPGFVEKWAWLIALVGALIGQGLVLAWTRDVVGNLIALPFLFVLLLFLTKWSAKNASRIYYGDQHHG